MTISLLTGYFAYIPAELIGVSAVIAGGDGGDLHGLVHARADDARGAADGRVGVGDRHVHAERDPLHADRAAAARDPRRARCLLRDRPALVGGGHLAHRARRPRSLGLPGGQAPAAAGAPAPRTRPDAASSGAGADHLVRDARRRLPRRGAGDPAQHRRRRAVPRPRPHPLPHLRRHLRHPRRPGPDAAGRDPPARPRGRRRGRRARAGAGADPGGERCPAAARRARRGGLGASRHRRAGPRWVRLQAQPLLGAGSTAATTARSRRARATSSGCGASCSNAERAAVHELRRSGEISDEVARRVERDLDLEDARLEI